MTNTEPSPRRELLRRYRSVPRDAWAERAKYATPRKYTATEADFLPQSLAVSERPSPIMPRVALWLLCLLVLIGIAWSMIGRIDVVVTASGRVLADGKAKSIQSVETQVVRHVNVRDGAVVKEGDVLIEFDPASADADIERATREIARATALAWAYKTLLDNLGDKPAVKSLRMGAPPDPARELATGTAKTRWAEYTARLERAQAEIARRRAEATSIAAAAAALADRIDRQLVLEADFRMMLRSNAVSRHAWMEQETRLREMLGERKRIEAQQQENETAITEALAALQLAFASEQAGWRERLSEASRELASAQADLQKAEYRKHITVLRSPEAGEVQQLTLLSPGAVANAGQQIMVIVPNADVAEIEAMIENKDVGLLRVGQRAEVKVETFDYTRYGKLPATLTLISRDSIADERGNLRYAARLELKRTSLQQGSRVLRLSPGMSVTADVHTGTRTIMSYFLSPIMKTVNEALREH